MRMVAQPGLQRLVFPSRISFWIILRGLWIAVQLTYSFSVVQEVALTGHGHLSPLLGARSVPAARMCLAALAAATKCHLIES
jgi:hypothetical protein